MTDKKKKYKPVKKKVEEKRKDVFFQPYVTDKWKGVIDVYKCVECGFPTESKAEIILHCVAHLPKAEQETALEILMEK